MNATTVVSYETAFQDSLRYFGEEMPAKVFLDKYALRDADDNLVESNPDQMHRRLAREFARVEAGKFKKPFSEDYLYGLFKNFGEIIPQGSPMYGIGNRYKAISLSNCYVVPSPLDSYGPIHEADEHLTQISKRRGGVGIDLSNLRPNGTFTNNSARSSSGVVSFMERYSNSIREVGQNGRRGALMISLSVHHPDILGFCRVKLDPTKVTGANVSVRLTDEFLRAVEADAEYEQRWPVEGMPKIRRMVRARDVWNEIIKCAHARAEPGVLFWDNIIRESPADCYIEDGFRSVSTNPCCVSEDEDHWVLTRGGVKNLRDVVLGDEVWVDDVRAWKRTSGYFHAGRADVVKVTLSNGESFTVTRNHKFLVASGKRTGTRVEYHASRLVEVSDIKCGDRIVQQVNVPDGVGFGPLGTREEGEVLGWMTGDGCLTYHDDAQTHPSVCLDFWQDEQDVAAKVQAAIGRLGYRHELQGNTKNNKTRLLSSQFGGDFIEKYRQNIWLFKSESEFNPFLFQASREFIVGYLAAYFSADGSVQCNHEAKSYNIQLTSVNRNRLRQVKQLLLMFGVKSSIGLSREAGVATFYSKTYQTKDCWRLTITGKENIARFAEAVPVLADKKMAKLKEIAALNLERATKCDSFVTVRSIEPAGQADVGCIEVEEAHRFSLNGVMSGNSELPLCAFDSCRLLLLNLFAYVRHPFTPEAHFDFDEFYRKAGVAQRLMDDLIDLELESLDRIIAKVESDPEPPEVRARELSMWRTIRSKCERGRRTGTGITALGDAMAAVGIRYGSRESVEFTERVYRTLKLGCYRASVDMARELGAFPVWSADKEQYCPFLLRIRDEDPGLYEDMQRFGRRNIALLTTAPAGTVSLEAGPAPYYGTTSGIEPLFMMLHVRRKKIVPGADGRVDFVDQNGDRWQEFPVFHPKLRMWMDITGETDVSKSPYAGCCAEDLDWRMRVRIQAVATRHIDHSISSTANLPEDVTVEEVATIYEEAWRSGCKGFTVYRKNCRSGVLVEAHVDGKGHGASAKTVSGDAAKRPRSLLCEAHRVRVKGVDYSVLVGMLDGAPYEVFAGTSAELNIPRKLAGGSVVKQARGHYSFLDPDGHVVCESITQAISDEEDALTRMVSTSLRHGVPLRFIVHQLEKSRGTMVGFSKGLARVLKGYIEDGTSITGENCSECGQAAIVRSEGCLLCKECGHSKCS